MKLLKKDIDLSEIKVRTRFAPSPTGHLHLGHVLSAEYVWQLAKKFQSDVLVRIEDHDTGRYREEYEVSILEDLKFLGYLTSTSKVQYQRDRFLKYESKLNELLEAGTAYYCDCTRREIIERMGSREKYSELHYDGHCRNRKLSKTENTGIRLKLDEKKYIIDDLYLGKLEQTPSMMSGDILLKDRHNLYTYLFSSTYDDILDGINLVVRGQDLTSSAAKQLQLREILGEKAKLYFYHHPLIFDNKGRKLSKRIYSESIKKLIDSGMSAKEIIDLAIKESANG